MAVGQVIEYLNPFSAGFRQAGRDFDRLRKEDKILAVAGSVFAGVATIWAGGIGAFAAFRLLVEHRKIHHVQAENVPSGQKTEKAAHGVLDSASEVPLLVEEEQQEVPLPDILVPESQKVTQFETLSEKPAQASEAGDNLFAKLFSLYNAAWDDDIKKFAAVPYDEARIKATFQQFVDHFATPVDYKLCHGFIEKLEVPAGTHLFVRADLHGDLKSLLENLSELKKMGWLDEHGRVAEGVQLVILGDYADRGDNGLDIIELLAALKLENPLQVHLIRGNHEDISVNMVFGNNDPHFDQYFFDGDVREENAGLLKQVYECMPMTLYLAQQGANGTKEFVQFTHGMFELNHDPAPLLDNDEATGSQLVSRSRALSERLEALDVDPDFDYSLTLGLAQLTEDVELEKSTRLKMAVVRIQDLLDEEEERCEMENGYMWGDVTHGTQSVMGSLSARQWKLCPEDVKHYLRLSSAVNKVKMVLRGHEHKFQHIAFKDKALVSTLPVGMETAAYQKRFKGQVDRAYLIAVAPRVKDWEKRALTRKAGSSVSELTEAYPLRSLEI